MTRRWLLQIVYLLLAASALVQASCIALAVGGAAGGAAAGYALYKSGDWYRDYPATLNDSATAVTTALGELKLPVVSEKADGDELNIESHTGDGTKIAIQLKSLASPIPADGASTHITVRVGAFGDQALSARILDQISLHLVAPVTIHPPVNAVPPSMNPAPANVPAIQTPTVRESAQPPLAK